MKKEKIYILILCLIVIIDKYNKKNVIYLS